VAQPLLAVLALGLVLLYSEPGGIRSAKALLTSEDHCAECDASARTLLGGNPYPLQQRLDYLARMGVDRWHTAGIRGRGVTIAVLDSGFRGYRAQLGKALPEQVAMRSFRSDGNLEARDSQHGILCGEVLHALAPEAALLFANWDPDQPKQFLEALRWARHEGATIVSCSMIMPTWSDGEGNGPVHEVVANILGNGTAPGDLLCFASAGNTAQRHWSGPFQDRGGWHEWEAGEVQNLLTPWGEERVSVEMCWQGETDYEIHIHDAGNGERVAEVQAMGALERHSAIVRFSPRSGHSYQVSVRCLHGPGGDFHLVVLGGNLRYSRRHGSIPFPGDGAEVVAVGAVDVEGRRADYSSCGPNSRCPKPDLAAVVPFYSLWRDQPFSGTSAAAPQAAGLAALIWSRQPQWTAGQVRAALKNAARGLGPAEHDDEKGYGCLALPP
jgi:subtilisin family serine protease